MAKTKELTKRYWAESCFVSLEAVFPCEWLSFQRDGLEHTLHTP